jgi:lipoate-protein ligase A
LIEALDQFGITAEFKPPNDLVVNSKKISGSAQAKKKNAYIIHSTIILRLDPEIINGVLKNPYPSYTSSIEHECGEVLDVNDLKTAIKNAFQKQFGIEFQNDDFSKLEKELIYKLMKNKYRTQEWTFKR